MHSEVAHLRDVNELRDVQLGVLFPSIAADIAEVLMTSAKLQKIEIFCFESFIENYYEVWLLGSIFQESLVYKQNQ